LKGKGGRLLVPLVIGPALEKRAGGKLSCLKNLPIRDSYALVIHVGIEGGGNYENFRLSLTCWEPKGFVAAYPPWILKKKVLWERRLQTWERPEKRDKCTLNLREATEKLERSSDGKELGFGRHSI